MWYSDRIVLYIDWYINCGLYLVFISHSILYLMFPYGDDLTKNPTTDLSDPLKMVITDQQGQNDSFREKVLDIFGFNVGQQGWGKTVDTLFVYIQALFNIALSLLAFCCLIIIIYHFFMIFFTPDTKWVESAKDSIKRVTIVLFIIWLSRLIVTGLFWVVSKAVL